MSTLSVQQLEVIFQACLNLEVPPSLPQDLEIKVLEALENDHSFRPGLPPGASMSKIRGASKIKRRRWKTIVGPLAYQLHSDRYLYGEVKKLSAEPQEKFIEYELFHDALSDPSGKLAALLSRLVTGNSDEDASQETVTCEMLELIGLSLEETRLVDDQLVFKKWARKLVGTPIKELVAAHNFFQEAQQISSTMQDAKPDYDLVAAALNKGFRKSESGAEKEAE